MIRSADTADEIDRLRTRLAEAEAALDAIRSGTADALVGENGGVFHLHGSERLYVTFFDAMNEGGVTLDDKGTILHCNACFAAMMGQPVHSLRGMRLLDCMAPDSRPGAAQLLARQDMASTDVWLAAQDGNLPVRLSITSIDNGLQQFRCVVMTDLSEHIAAETELRDAVDRQQDAETQLRDSQERLRAMYANQQATIEMERKRVAREVHDDLGQVLTALRMETTMLQRELRGRLPALGRIDEMRLLIESLFKSVRSIAGNLQPSTLDLGLAPAIEWLANDFEKRWQIDCALDIDPRDIQIDERLATPLFRVIQESLTNVARHARATSVCIALRQSDSGLRMEIVDNGRGFNYDPVMIHGFGLFGMRERVIELGGSLTIQTAPEQGTSILVDLPLTRTARR